MCRTHGHSGAGTSARRAPAPPRERRDEAPLTGGALPALSRPAAERPVASPKPEGTLPLRASTQPPTVPPPRRSEGVAPAGSNASPPAPRIEKSSGRGAQMKLDVQAALGSAADREQREGGGWSAPQRSAFEAALVADLHKILFLSRPGLQRTSDPKFSRLLNVMAREVKTRFGEEELSFPMPGFFRAAVAAAR